MSDMWVVKIVNRAIGKNMSFIVQADSAEQLRDKFGETYFSKIGLEIEEVIRVPDWTAIDSLDKTVKT